MTITENSHSFGSKDYFLHEFSKVTDFGDRNMIFVSHVNILVSEKSITSKFYTNDEKIIFLRNMVEVFESMRFL